MAERKELFRIEPKGKIEKFLFEKVSYLKFFLLAIAICIPYIIFYFPGNIQTDAIEQLYSYLGEFPITGKHSVIVTQLMGRCLYYGRTYFSSDIIGLALYNIPQILIQCACIAYALWIICKAKMPIILQWSSVIFWLVLPFFPSWGYTMVKDSYYYIFTLVFVCLLFEMIYFTKENFHWWKWTLFILSACGMAFFRNNGKYIVYITVIAGIVLCRRYWKVYLISFIAVVLCMLFINDFYMPNNSFEKGPIKEALSIPLQQTVRYISEHPDEITEEEAAAIQEIFMVSIFELPDYYNPELSDFVKERMIDYPSSEEVKNYFSAWFSMLIKHPDTYIQAFINHTYGYFYPDREGFWGYRICLSFGGSFEEWPFGVLELKYPITNSYFRHAIREYANLTQTMPIISLFVSCGCYVLVLMGETLYLLSQKRKKEILLLIPSILLVGVCLLSPVDAFFRYILPLAVVTPIHLYIFFRQISYEEGEN